MLIVHETTLQHLLHVTKLQKKTEMGLNLWIHELAISFLKTVVDNTVVRLKAKEIYDHITQGQKNDKPFSASAHWPTCFKR